jgi:hypothetical protein
MENHYENDIELNRFPWTYPLAQAHMKKAIEK